MDTGPLVATELLAINFSLKFKTHEFEEEHAHGCSSSQQICWCEILF